MYKIKDRSFFLSRSIYFQKKSLGIGGSVFIDTSLVKDLIEKSYQVCVVVVQIRKRRSIGLLSITLICQF